MNTFTKYTLKYFFALFFTILIFKKVAVGLLNSSTDLYTIFGVGITVCILLLWVNIIKKDFFDKKQEKIENSNEQQTLDSQKQ